MVNRLANELNFSQNVKFFPGYMYPRQVASKKKMPVNSNGELQISADLKNSPVLFIAMLHAFLDNTTKRWD